MNLRELRDTLEVELGDIDIGGWREGGVTDADLKHVLISVNLALGQLTRKLRINSDVVRINPHPLRYEYPMVVRHAVNYTGADAHADKFIIDNPAYPFDRDATTITGVIDPTTNQSFVMNNSNSPFSLRVQGNKVVIPPELGLPSVLVTYVKPYAKVDVNELNDDFILPFEEELALAVVYFICYRLHKLEGFDGTQNASNAFYMKYHEEIKSIIDTNSMNTSDTLSTTRLYVDGWEK